MFWCVTIGGDLVGTMFKLWNFSATLGRPTQEEKERKRKQREAQLQQIQRELTLDRKLVSASGNGSSNGNGHYGRPQRAKTFRHNQDFESDLKFNHHNEVKYRPKKSVNSDESQFVSRLRFFGDSPSPPLVSKRHSSAFLTPDDDQRPGPDLYGMRRRYTVAALDSEDTDFTTSTTGRANIVTFATSTPKLRFSDQTVDMSTTSGTNRSSHTSYGTSEDDDGFAVTYRSALKIYYLFSRVIHGIEDTRKMNWSESLSCNLPGKSIFPYVDRL